VRNVKYENPPIEEGINYSQEHPLKEFAQLLLGIGILIALVLLVLNFFAGALAKRIPFEYEQAMLSSVDIKQIFEDEELSEAGDYSTQENYLQAIADKLIPAMGLPEGMAVQVHYSASDTVNAFATLGGNMLFFKGLIDAMDSEDELAAVMGHEIAHIKLRHPIVALGKGLTIATLAASISGSSGSSAGNLLLGSSAQLSMLKFSREQEAAADAESALALAQVYGHIGGADLLFQHFSEIEGEQKTKPAVMEMFRSHPYSEDRWQNLQQLALHNGWSTSGSLQKLAFPEHQPTKYPPKEHD